jgi:hypothetical protein
MKPWVDLLVHLTSSRVTTRPCSLENGTSQSGELERGCITNRAGDIGGNRALELPGNPLEDFGALFGPVESDSVAVRARIHSERSKRLVPRFGVGLNGVAGYRLLVAPAKTGCNYSRTRRSWPKRLSSGNRLHGHRCTCKFARFLRASDHRRTSMGERNS